MRVVRPELRTPESWRTFAIAHPGDPEAWNRLAYVEVGTVDVVSGVPATVEVTLPAEKP